MNFIDLVNTFEFTSASPLSFVVGELGDGELALSDIKKTTHIFVGGRAGSGKTNFLFSLITSLLIKNNENDLKIFTIDGKENNEFEVFDGVKQVKNINNFDNFRFMLQYLDNEIQLRASMFSKNGLFSVEDYNKCEDVTSGRADKLPYMVIVLDDIVWYLKEDNMIANQLHSLIARARSYGIYFVLSAQTADCLPFNMINDFPSRICFNLPIINEYVPILREFEIKDLAYNGECLCRLRCAYDMEKVKCPLADYKTIKELLKV